MFLFGRTGGPCKSQLGKLVTLYDGGDAILSVAGNEGFRILKMLEAHCSPQWTIVGHQERPEIPLSPAFETYLKISRKILETYPDEFRITSFFDCILSETDPLMIGVFYGSFRHWGHPFIDYKEGLKKLFDQVHKTKVISDWCEGPGHWGRYSKVSLRSRGSGLSTVTNLRMGIC